MDLLQIASAYMEKSKELEEIYKYVLKNTKIGGMVAHFVELLPLNEQVTYHTILYRFNYKAL